MNLLQKIKSIDPEAADYLENTVIPRWPGKKFIEPDDLIFLFIWKLTPQKNPYWRNIYLKLNEMEDDD